MVYQTGRSQVLTELGTDRGAMPRQHRRDVWGSFWFGGSQTCSGCDDTGVGGCIEFPKGGERVDRFVAGSGRTTRLLSKKVTVGGMKLVFYDL